MFSPPCIYVSILQGRWEGSVCKEGSLWCREWECWDLFPPPSPPCGDKQCGWPHRRRASNEGMPHSPTSIHVYIRGYAACPIHPQAPLPPNYLFPLTALRTNPIAPSFHASPHFTPHSTHLVTTPFSNPLIHPFFYFKASWCFGSFQCCSYFLCVFIFNCN